MDAPCLKKRRAEMDPKTGEVVTRIPLQCIIAQPLVNEKLPVGRLWFRVVVEIV